MADYTVKRFEEMEPLFGGFFPRARASLGASAFGMQILQMPANSGGVYPPDDHAESGQEEVYVLLAGSAVFEIDGERVDVEADTAVRVAADAKRHIAPGPDGAKIRVLGGTPGRADEAPAWAELGGGAYLSATPCPRNGLTADAISQPGAIGSPQPLRRAGDGPVVGAGVGTDGRGLQTRKEVAPSAAVAAGLGLGQVAVHDDDARGAVLWF